MPKIRRIKPKVAMLTPKKRVAAYARVSMETDRLSHSLSAQVSYYSTLIQKNPDWIYAGVFADNGISGTGTANRIEFQKMIAAADRGEIDIILTKSIQRFARNTVDLLQTVRHLKDIGVEVRFEKENIRSLSGDGELMLSILASFAQEESISISKNVKWATKKRFEKGIPNGRFRIYGYRWEGDTLVPVPEEAAIVKRIFQNFLDGKSRLETEREFAAEGIRTRNGCRWVDSNIRSVLTNIHYTGCLLLQKYRTEDPLTHRQVVNRGELPKYLVENTHEAIIDKETFNYVQDEMARRKALGSLANKSLNTSCFTGKIKCPSCGKSYMHKHHSKYREREYWVCGTINRKGGKCAVGGTINHNNMKKVCAQVLGLAEFDEAAFLARVDFINVPARETLEIHLKSGEVVTKACPNTGHQECWTAEYRARISEERRTVSSGKRASAFTGKIKCVHCGANFRRKASPSTVAEDGKYRYWRCSEHKGCDTIGLREDLLKAFVAKAVGRKEFDEETFREEVACIAVYSADRLEFHFKDGRTIRRNWERK